MPSELLESILGKNTDEIIQSLLKKDNERQRSLLPPSTRRIVLILEEGIEQEMERDKDLPFPIPVSPGFQT